MEAVLFLSGRTMGDALGSAGRLMEPSFSRLGYKFIEINLLDSNAMNAVVAATRANEVAFAFSFVAMGSDLGGSTTDGRTVNFWQFSRIPFLSIYGDTPAYYFDRHVLPGKSFACLYNYREHCVMRKRLPAPPGLIAIVPPASMDRVEKESINFAAKENGRLLFLKNGNDPDELLRSWRASLPSSTFEMLTDLASELAGRLTSPVCNDIDAMVRSYFANTGFDIDGLTSVRLFFTAQLDDYCRRLKSTLIAESLMDYPVEIHGYNWDHLDFSGRRARLIPVADFEASRSMIRESLGVIDMSPNTSSAPHDRMCRAFGAHTLCLTNEQEFLTDTVPEHGAITFRFEKDSIQDKVADVLANRRRYVEIGATVAATFRKNEDQDLWARFLLNCAQILRLDCSSRMPALQNYFGWPPTKLP